jgi:hypothetical protein
LNNPANQFKWAKAQYDYLARKLFDRPYKLLHSDDQAVVSELAEFGDKVWRPVPPLPPKNVD